MSSLSVNSVNSSDVYLRTSVAQQRVSTDRADIRQTETVLQDLKSQLDKDLTYLAKLQQKASNVQDLESSQSETNTIERLAKSARSAKQVSQQALNALIGSTSDSPTMGSFVNVFA